MVVALLGRPTTALPIGAVTSCAEQISSAHLLLQVLCSATTCSLNPRRSSPRYTIAAADSSTEGWGSGNLYNLLVFIHVVGVLGFVLTHGVSTWMTLAVRRERDPERLRTLLDLSGSTTMAFYIFDLPFAAGRNRRWV